jgi:ABC-type microcin C transport system permease subunit YejB
MLAYLLKRILLMIPTLIGVITLTFVVIQFVPGGPVEQMMLEMKGRAVLPRPAAAVPSIAAVAAWTRTRSRRSGAVRLRQAADRALFPDAQALCKV